MPIQCKKAKYSKKTTKPKPRYTIGTLLSDLPSVAKYMKDERLRAIMIEKDQGKEGEHGGIGTPATRDDIIQSLFDDGFIEPEKPGSDRIKSTRKGKRILHFAS